MKAILRTIDGADHVVDEGEFLLEEYKRKGSVIFNDIALHISDDNGNVKGIVNMKHVSSIRFES